MPTASPVRFRLDLSYDGTDFSGWAAQPGRRTVSGVIGEALAILFRTPVPMVVAGRTDAGVHALGQVAHIDIDPEALAALAPRHRRPAAGRPGAGSVPPTCGDAADLDGETVPKPDTAGGLLGLRRRLAGILPSDVRVRSVRQAPVGFDARFAALRRHYRYRIGTADWGVEPGDRHDTLAWRRSLDARAMAEAAAMLTGLRDFAAFCKPREGATTVRDLQRLNVIAEGDLIRVEVTADAFCHSMVRSLVGVLIAVGELRIGVDRPAALLAQRARTAQVPVAPALGLTLIGVDYPPDADLARRAQLTRALRSALPPGTDPATREQ